MLTLPQPVAPDRSRHEQSAYEVVTEIQEVLVELGVRIEARPGRRLYYTPRKVVGGYLRELMKMYKAELVEEQQGRGAA